MELEIEATPSKVELGVGHQLGKLLVGSVAAFGANKLSDRLYDSAVMAIRARRNNT